MYDFKIQLKAEIVRMVQKKTKSELYAMYKKPTLIIMIQVS
jgi:hypothetical protein